MNITPIAIIDVITTYIFGIRDLMMTLYLVMRHSQGKRMK